jgi:hypothetical protein
MWNRITKEDWIVTTKKLDLSLFYNSEYLDCIADVFKLKIHYFICTTKEGILALGAFFCDSNRNIVLPEGFSYSSFYLKNDLTEKSYGDLQISLIKILKSEFKNIKLKFETTITDVRPFIWEGFNLEVKYTHIKTNDLPPEASVINNLSKQVVKEYRFEVEELNNSNLLLNLEFLKKLSFSAKKIKELQKLLQLWAECNYLKAYSIYKKNILVCSNLVLIDFNSSKVYTILLNKPDKQYKFAHSYLYHSMIEWGKENGINTIDFCGANYKSISEFKSRFNTELTMYFVVSYSPLRAKLKSAYSSIIYILSRAFLFKLIFRKFL